MPLAGSIYTFDPGIDFTTLFGGYATALTQAIQLATPNSEHGIITYVEAQPPVSGQPGGYPANWYEFNARGLWIKPSTGETYSYKSGYGFVNVATLIPANTITGGMVVDGTLPVSKLNVPGGTPAGYVLRVDSGGTFVEYSDPATLYATGGLPAAKIAPGTANQFLRTIGGNVVWDTFDGADINALLATSRLTAAYIEPGVAYQVLMTDPTSNYPIWVNINTAIPQNSLTVDRLIPLAGGASKLLGINSSGTGWEMVNTPATTVLSKKWESALLALADATVSHNAGPTPIATVPLLWQVKLVCISADRGYSVNDEVDLNNTIADYPTEPDGPWCSITADATNFVIKIWSGGTGTIRLINKSTGTETGNIDPAKWNFKITAFAA